MGVALDQLKRSRSDVDLFLNLLDKASRPGARIVFEPTGISEPAELTLAGELEKILKAQVFLMAYNAVEAGIRVALKDMIDKVMLEDCSYMSLKPTFRKKLAHASISKIVDSVRTEQEKKIHDWFEFAISDGYMAALRYQKQEKQEKILRKQTQSVGDQSSHPLDDDRKLFEGGSLDYAALHKLSEKYCFDLPQKDEMVAKTLLIIKRNRNDLAHGRKTFLEAAKDTPSSELIHNVKLALEYLSKIIASIEDATAKKRYFLE